MIQDGDTSLRPVMSACPEDIGSSFPDGSLGSKAKERKLSEKPEGKIPCKVNLSPLRMFLKTIQIPVILTKAMIEFFLHLLRNLMYRREICLILNLTGQQNLTLHQMGGLFELCISQIWTVMTQFSILMKILHNISINTGLRYPVQRG